MVFYQPAEGYRYNSDSLFLYAFASRFHPRGEMLDVGSGCGILGLLLAKNHPVQLTSLEKQPFLADYTEINARVNGIASDLAVENIMNFQTEKRFDLIICNPPFWDSNVIQSQHPVTNACRYVHHMPVDGLTKAVHDLLTPKGQFLFCYDAKQLPCVLAALTEVRLQPETIRFVHPKKERDSTIFMCRAKKNSKSPLNVLPPLYVFDGEAHTREVSEIFAMCNSYSITAEIGES